MEKFSPFSCTTVSRPFANFCTCSFKLLRSKTRWISSSEWASKGSTLKRKDPAKRTASWGIKEIRDRKTPRPSAEMSTPPIEIVPDSGSTIRRIPSSTDDLPLPVLPQIPTRSRSATLIVSSFTTIGKSGRYLSTRPEISMVACAGHSAGGWRSGSISCGASVGSLVYSRTLSTETMLASRSEAIRTVQFKDCVTEIAYVSESPATPALIVERAAIAKKAAAPTITAPIVSRRTASQRLPVTMR
mmetsp:Transcript_17479/g.47841  ORF Transcript_17479/g.47841 Transcript_17479/m.47841 type:complete len:244 (-) Transcript_17479:3495-4226(-)